MAADATMERQAVSTHHRTTRIPQRGAIRRVFSILWFVLAFCGLGLAGYQVAIGQWHATPVLSGSMRPGLQPGDIVVTHRVPITDLRVRDVVVFRPPDKADHLTVHRIVKLTVKGPTTSITTWGDANTVADSTISSLKGTTAYRVERVVPLVGYPAIWLQNGQRGLMVIGLGALLLLAAVVTLLRPDQPTKPPGSPDEVDSSDDKIPTVVR
jgi:signal peptidase